jgi:hypothetical protein
LSDAGSHLAITNSTFVGVLPGQDPESIETDSGNATIASVTIAGSDITATKGHLTLRNSILADVHCFSGVSGAGNNLQFGDVSQCPGVTADPALDPQGLQFNGGPTPTLAILQLSAAIDAVPLIACTDQNGKRLKSDQRGFTRPAPKHKACDIGAFELRCRAIALRKASQRTTRRLQEVPTKHRKHSCTLTEANLILAAIAQR